LAGLDAVLPAADEDGLAGDQGLGDLGAAALEHTSDRLAGDAHGRRRLLVAESLEIDEADGLELIDGQRELLQVAPRHPRRLEQRHTRHSAYGSFNRWTRHWAPR
jgi:hypothetical protein